MALILGAVVGQFEMPGSLVYKNLMHQPDAQQTFESPVDCDLVEVFFSRSPGNLVLAERFARPHQNRQDGNSVAGAVELNGFQHFTGLRFQI